MASLDGNLLQEGKIIGWHRLHTAVENDEPAVAVVYIHVIHAMDMAEGNNVLAGFNETFVEAGLNGCLN